MNCASRLEGDAVSYDEVQAVIGRMRQPEFWTDSARWSAIAAVLPEYRLSKFQRALPSRFSEEVVMGYLLDVDGARKMIEKG